LLELGLVDTVSEHSAAYRLLQPSALTNQYAAMPSLHFGWNLLVGIALFTHARSPLWRLFALAVPGGMLVAVVVTGNHYILDPVAGAFVALSGLAGSYATGHWLGERDGPVSEPAGAASR
jgi:hypothetical protein